MSMKLVPTVCQFFPIRRRRTPSDSDRNLSGPRCVSSGLPLHAGGPSRFPVRRFAHEGRYFGRFNAVRTSRIADSIDDMGRKAEMAGMWPGTRS
jgi:hypothetical protein